MGGVGTRRVGWVPGGWGGYRAGGVGIGVVAQDLAGPRFAKTHTSHACTNEVPALICSHVVEVTYVTWAKFP